MDILFLVGRILFGGFFTMMGLNHFMKMDMLKGYAQSKGVPAPGLMVPLTGLLLLGGGLSVLLGVYTNIGPWLLVVFLFFTSLKMHNFWALEDPQTRMNEMNHFLKNMALLGASLMLLLLSSWPLSL